MTVENPVVSHRMRFRTMILLAALIGALLVGISGLTSYTAKADAVPCTNGMPCAFVGSYYFGDAYNIGCSSVGHFGKATSAKNNCAWNIRMGWIEGGVLNWKFCMSPGGLRPDPGRFNYIGTC
jgi:hypothetical protein